MSQDGSQQESELMEILEINWRISLEFKTKYQNDLIIVALQNWYVISSHMNTLLCIDYPVETETRCSWTEKMIRGVSHQWINDPDHFHSYSTDRRRRHSTIEELPLYPWEKLHHSPSVASIFLQRVFDQCNVRKPMPFECTSCCSGVARVPRIFFI